MLQRVRLGQSPVEVVPLGVGCWAWGDQRVLALRPGPRTARRGGRLRRLSRGRARPVRHRRGLRLGQERADPRLARPPQRRGLSSSRRSTRRSPAAAAPRRSRRGLPAVSSASACRASTCTSCTGPDRDEAPIAAAMDVLAEAVKSRARRAPSASATSAPSEMREAHAALARHGVPLAVNQVRYSLLHRSPEVDGVLDACRELGVTLLAYSPLEQGLLTGKYNARKPAARPARRGRSFLGEQRRRGAARDRRAARARRGARRRRGRDRARLAARQARSRAACRSEERRAGGTQRQGARRAARSGGDRRDSRKRPNAGAWRSDAPDGCNRHLPRRCLPGGEGASCRFSWESPSGSPPSFGSIV